MGGAVGYDLWFPKTCDTKFVVRNIARGNKTVRVWNYPILNGKTRDLMTIPAISEADIRNGLLKGELGIKFKTRELVVVESNIDLIQFDPCQKEFLESIGITVGLSAGGDGSLPVNFKQNISLIGARDGNNRIFKVPSPDKFINGIFQNNEFRILVRHNGKGLEENIDYIVAESGGSGTGYDTIILTNMSPPPRSRLLCDYVVQIG